jgi:hypothetical protein
MIIAELICCPKVNPFYCQKVIGVGVVALKRSDLTA